MTDFLPAVSCHHSPVEGLARTTSPFLRLLGCVLLLLLSFSSGALASPEARSHVIFFLNGESLSGKVVGEADGHVIFESAALGEIRIAKERIQRIEYPPMLEIIDIAEVTVAKSPPVVEEPARAVEEADVVAREEVEEPEPPEPEQPPVVRENGLTAMETVRQLPEPSSIPSPTLWDDNLFFRMLDRYNPIAHWDSQLQLGFVLHFGNTEQQDVSIRFHTTDTTRDKRNQRVELSWEYGTRRDSLGSTVRWRDRRRGLYRLRYNFAERFYWQAATRYHSETVQGINHELDQTTGIGYTYVKSERWTGSVTPSLGVQYRDVRRRDTEWVAIISIFQDLEYRMTTRTRIRETFSIDLYPKDSFTTSANFAAILESQLSDRLRLNLRYEVTYNGLARPGISRDQQIMSMSLATSF